MVVIEPLRLILPQLLAVGQPRPVDFGRARFGTPNQYKLLAEKIEANKAEGAEIFIDLTPFERLGLPEVLAKILVPTLLKRSCTILTLSGEPLETLREAGITEIAGIAVFEDNGEFAPTKSLGDDGSIARHAAFLLLEKIKTLNCVHERLAQQKLLNVLSKAVEHGYEAPDSDRVAIAGRDYLRLPSGMLVSSYVNLKKLYVHPENVLDLGFEIVRVATGGYRRGTAVENDCDLYLAPTNSSLVLAAIAQTLTGTPCGVIDKLGPIPARHLASISTSIELRDRRVCLITDVSSTGGEIDRSLQYLHYRRAQVVKVICCFHWEAGTPQLCDENIFLPLCTPKRELGYVYRSE